MLRLSALVGLLATPGAAQEYLTVKDGHLAWQSGERARFWGVNLVDELGREKAEIDQISGRIPQMGFNACRLHLYDTRLLDADATGPNGLPTSRVPREAERGDDSVLDRYDYAIAKLEEQGLRLFLTFDRARHTFQPGDVDVLPDRSAEDSAAWSTAIEEVSGWGREQLVYIDDRCAELQLEYTRLQLDRTNLYTGRRVAEDPYVILYELTNENGFMRDMLGGKHQNWPDYFREELQAKWNAWLRERHGTGEALAKAWGKVAEGEDLGKGTVAFGLVSEYPRERAADVHRFVYDRFLGFSERQVELIRSLAPEGVGCNVTPICYDTVHEHRLPWMAAASQADFLCIGTYTNEVTRNKESPYYPFSCPLLGEPGHYNLSYQGAADKPTVIYENNVLKPAPFRASYPFRVAALASWQDWDAVFWYIWGNGTVLGQDDPQTYVDTGLRYAVPEHTWHGIVIATDEVLLAALRAAGDMFRLFHVKPMPDPLIIDVGTENLLHTAWVGDVDVPTPEGATGRYPKASAQNATNYTRGLRYRFRFDREETTSPAGLTAKLTSSVVQNGEVTYDWERGVLLVDTPGAKAAVGLLGEGHEFRDGVGLGGVDEEFVAFAVVSQDGQALSETEEAVAILTGTGENTGFEMRLEEWEANEGWGYQHLTKSWGAGPVQVKRPNAEVTLPKPFSARVLDFLMQPVAELSGRNLRFTREMPVFVVELRPR